MITTFNTVVACRRNRFNFWDSCKRLQNFVDMETLRSMLYGIMIIIYMPEMAHDWINKFKYSILIIQGVKTMNKQANM